MRMHLHHRAESIPGARTMTASFLITQTSAGCVRWTAPASTEGRARSPVLSSRRGVTIRQPDAPYLEVARIGGAHIARDAVARPSPLIDPFAGIVAGPEGHEEYLFPALTPPPPAEALQDHRAPSSCSCVPS